MNNQNQSKYYIRFVLELLALFSTGWWASTWFSGWVSVLLSASVVIVLMIVWGVFNVPKDPSRSGKAPVVVSGKTRLAIEFAIFLFPTFAFLQMNLWYGITYALTIMTHYIHTKERVLWLLKQ